MDKSKKLTLPKDFVKVRPTGTDFLISGTKQGFLQLWKAFIEAPILRHFHPESHICIETNTLGYGISRVLSQVTTKQYFFNQVTHKDSFSSKSKIGHCYPIPFFSRKMIFTKTYYKTYNPELLAIIEIFKTWHHYLKDCKYKVLALTDYNNLCWFIDTKSLSFC